MSFRTWLSVGTLLLLAVILFLSRHELLRAWQLLAQVNIWILLLLVPGQILAYYAAAEMTFSYLRAKQSIENVPGWILTRIALEANFVNHVLPSGGVSGVSYVTWRLGKFGVPPGRATMAQIVRFAMGFVAFIILLLVSVLAVTIDGNINRWIILVSCMLVAFMLGAMILGMYLLHNKKRTERFAGRLVKTINHLIWRITFGQKRHILSNDHVQAPLLEMHHDYLALRHDSRILIRPLVWGLVFTAADAALFSITFWALGQPVNPAPILIAYGVASFAGFLVVTPGGTGAYEAIMVTFLAFAGVAGDVAIAGILLTRVILLLTTIGLGYIFYQQALIQNGRKRTDIDG